jgi:hypothetical protein
MKRADHGIRRRRLPARGKLCYAPAMTLAQVLQEEFDARKERNSRYSLRAFARDLRIDPSNLSKLLAGKRKPAESVIEHLKEITREQHPRLHLNLSKVFVRTAGGFYDFHPVADYERLLQWQNILVLESLKLRSQPSHARDLQSVTGLSAAQILSALEVLVEFGLVTRDSKSAKFEANLKNVSTGGESAQRSEAFRAYQRQLLERAALAIGDGADVGLRSAERGGADRTSPERALLDRSQTSTVFCIEKARLPLVAKKITAFRRSLVKLLDGGSGRNDGVYALCVSLFPLRK